MYKPEILSYSDYYPFGWALPGGAESRPDQGYRYGFNGKEQDNEVKGDGVQYDYGFRIYDARIARFMSVDPLTKSYPELTPYQFASNSPIAGVDLDGLEFALRISPIVLFRPRPIIGTPNVGTVSRNNPNNPSSLVMPDLNPNRNNSYTGGPNVAFKRDGKT